MLVSLNCSGMLQGVFMDEKNGVEKARISAFLKEFPFVEKFIPETQMLSEKLTVQRIDLDLLERKASTIKFARINYYSEWFETRFLFFQKDGKEIAETKQYDFAKERFNLLKPSTWIIKEVVGETVFQTIERIGMTESAKVAYILERRDWFPAAYRKEHDDAGLIIKIHKLPKGYTLQGWIKQLNTIAENELKETLQKIDEAD